MSVLVHLDHVHKSYDNAGKREEVLHDVQLQVHKGEFVSILGKSGCGKSTLLNMIGGFEAPDQGTVLLDQVNVTAPTRRCIMLFQNYGLLPWRTVLKNVELALEPTNLSASERKDRAIEYLQLVGLEDSLGRFPSQLSGGMKQRVAIARALCLRPEVILMDEPFAALDTFTRYYLQDELLRIQKQSETTIVLVTHDIDEAIYLSDRVLIMEAHPGRIQSELSIELSKPRDRSHSDFQHYRSLIFDAFHVQQHQKEPEFTI